MDHFKALLLPLTFICPRASKRAVSTALAMGKSAVFCNQGEKMAPLDAGEVFPRIIVFTSTFFIYRF